MAVCTGVFDKFLTSTIVFGNSFISDDKTGITFVVEFWWTNRFFLRCDNLCLTLLSALNLRLLIFFIAALRASADPVCNFIAVS